MKWSYLRSAGLLVAALSLGGGAEIAGGAPSAVGRPLVARQATATVEPTAGATATAPAASPTVTAAPASPTATVESTATPQPSPTAPVTPTVAATATATPQATATVTATATVEATATPATPTATATPTGTPPVPPPPPSLGTDPAAAAPFRLYVPLAYRAAGSWDTGVQVQNVGGGDVNVYISFYQQGSLVLTEPAATIAAGASRTYYLPAINGLANGFSGSVIVGASGPVAAVVNWTNYNVNGTGRSSTTSYNAIAAGQTGTTVAVPGLRWTNIVQIQNPGGQTATARLTTYNVGGIPTGSQEFQIGAYQSLPVDLGFARSEQGGSAVSAVVASLGDNPQPLAVLAWGEIQSPAGVPMSVSFTGITKSAPNLLAPLLMRRPTGWATEMAIQNLGQQTAQVTIQYFDTSGQPVPGASENVFIPANGLHLARQADIAALPTDFVGSAVVSAANGQPLALSVVQLNMNLNQATSYVGVERSAANVTLFAPLVMKANNGWDTGVQVQNVSNVPTTVTVTYYPRDSFTPVSTQTQVVQPNSPYTFFTPDAPGLPATFVGSAVLNATGGAQIVGVVNEVNYLIGNGGDNSLTYSLVGGE